MSTRSVNKLSMEEASALLIKKGVKTLSDFKRLKRDGLRPATIPSNPESYYPDYPGWKAFIKLGEDVETSADEAPSYAELKKLNLRFGVRTQQNYLKAVKDGVLPVGSPTNPEAYFGNEFVSWQDFLAPKSKFVSFEEARRFARQLGLKSSYEWRQYCRQGAKPDYIPVLPDRDYGEFISWQDFLVGDD